MNENSSATEHNASVVASLDCYEVNSSPIPSSMTANETLPDYSKLVEEIARLAKLVGFLKAENERLAAERHNLMLRLQQSEPASPQQNAAAGGAAQRAAATAPRGANRPRTAT
jgi:hypothetical protein